MCTSELKAIRAALETERAAGTLDYRGFINHFLEIIKDGKLTQADYEPTVQLAEELYMEYIEPLDIPRIGPVLEKFLDQAILAQIRPTLRSVFDRYVAG